MNTDNIIKVIDKMGCRMEKEKLLLTELDNAIADGDHGINMAKGFAAVKTKLEEQSTSNIGAVLKTVGMTLVSAVGGSAGPLYGTAFMRAGMVEANKNEMEINDFLLCMKAANEGVMMRGKSVYGEKTMLDSMIPALEAMEKANCEGLPAKAVLEAGVKAAREGVEFKKR